MKTIEIAIEHYKVIFKPEISILEISGNIYSSNIDDVFAPIIEAIKDYFQSKIQVFSININLRDHIGHAAIFTLKQVFELAQENVSKVFVNWYYPKEEEDLEEFIEEIIKTYPLIEMSVTEV